jgi:glucuronate isomerase
LSAHGILDTFKVSVVCTTDDPTDSLEHHQATAKAGIGTRMYPTFRPDKAIGLADVSAWNAWTDKLASVSAVDCADLEGFCAALRARHDFFHELGGRLSDHGLSTCFADFPDDATAARIFAKARAGQQPDGHEQVQLASWMMAFFGRLDAEKGWVKQLHLGAMRNVNTALFRQLGPDIGCDSIGDYPQGNALAGYLGKLAGDGILPKTILYNLNPADNYLFATMIGNFQEGGVAGKMQFGSGWWFLDQEEGMRWQINALSQLGLLGRFVGMLTDSRSFMSYCRHEYFRRLLCDMIGSDVVSGRLPKDWDLLKRLVHNVCYGNAAQYFGFQLGDYSPGN